MLCPISAAVLSLLVCLVPAYLVCSRPALENCKVNDVVAAMQLFYVVSFLASLLVLVIDDANSIVPQTVLYVGLISIFLVLSIQLLRPRPTADSEIQPPASRSSSLRCASGPF